MQGRMNLPVRGGGGEGVTLNVFAQSAEPATKNGIWINTSASGSLPEMSKFEYDGVEITTNNDMYVKGNIISDYIQRNQVFIKILIMI